MAQCRPAFVFSLLVGMLLASLSQFWAAGWWQGDMCILVQRSLGRQS